MRKVYFKIGLGAFIVFLLDQGLKFIATHHFSPPLILNSWFTLRYEQNFGIAWSIAIPYPFLVLSNIVLLMLIPFFIAQNLDLRHKLSQIILTFIIGGSLGNLFDRIFLGYVVDYIAIGWWPVFNLADLLLSSGVFLILFFHGKIMRNT